ncbi:substrate-binding domain-containing protein [Halobacillus litoralis]|uniref:PstS family phosphate ABC transporter substrate-binding protein n=1 Tax=Halobacillus litoralis TaxID=45668 RepID=UPI001CD5E47C|nr:substrate-binding domain-containing protein [Halobacillus litoralis]MCA0970255.1 substrate-binding domain-containing protein [Halobacillus litoralis]
MAKRIIGAVIFTVLYSMISLFVVGISLLASSKNGYIYIAIALAALGITLNLFILGYMQKWKKGVQWGVILSLFLLPLGGYGGFEWYMNKIEIRTAEVDLEAYEPFAGQDKLAQLDQPSTLKLTGELPHLDGATALYPVYSAFTQAVYPEKDYSHQHTGESEVVVTKTNSAYLRLQKGAADLIIAAGPSEQQAERLGRTMEKTAIGREAFVFFVHESNPVQNLTIKELKGIYSGRITNWKEVGGSDQEIIAFQRPEGSGSQTGLQNMMGTTPIMEPPMDERVAGMGGIIEKASTYRNYRNAIGFSYRYFATRMVDENRIKLLEVNGVAPTVETIRSDHYPLTAAFYAITNGTTNPNVEPLIEWMLSPQGQSLIEKTGYVPIQ